jgi:hypothetical protein
MVEKQIDPEILASHFEGVLAADEGEADTQFEEESPKMFQETGFQFLLSGVL